METKKQKEKKIKAWLVADGKGVPLVFMSMKNKPEESIYFIYKTEKEARRQWDGFKIIQCLITYSL